MTPTRQGRFREVISRRQPGLTVVLENVHDPHNISAVLRSCDSVGIYRVYALYTEEHKPLKHMKLGRRASAGARRWVDVLYFDNPDACFQQVRTHCDQVLGTYLDEEAESLYELDLTRKVALVFGNEHDGLSRQTLANCDGTFHIPQAGMVQSLNISVACAVTLYEAYRQRKAAGLYGKHSRLAPDQRKALFQEYVRRHEEKAANKSFKKDS